MSVTDIFVTGADLLGIEVNSTLTEQLGIYAALLREWNEKINLTGILDDRGIAEKHFLDSLTLLKYTDIKSANTFIDVGTGAGFPGLVIAAALPGLSVTLLDSTGKKLKAVADIAEKMGVNNISVVHMRAEEAGALPEYREKFDFAASRAVATLNILSEYCLPFVKVGGTFAAMKGDGALHESEEAKAALSLLGGKTENINTFDFFDYGQRNIITVKKISQIPTKYPRVSAQIAKKPL